MPSNKRTWARTRSRKSSTRKDEEEEERESQCRRLSSLSSSLVKRTDRASFERRAGHSSTRVSREQMRETLSSGRQRRTRNGEKSSPLALCLAPFGKRRVKRWEQPSAVVSLLPLALRFGRESTKKKRKTKLETGASEAASNGCLKKNERASSFSLHSFLFLCRSKALKQAAEGL